MADRLETRPARESNAFATEEKTNVVHGARFSQLQVSQRPHENSLQQKMRALNTTNFQQISLRIFLILRKTLTIHGNTIENPQKGLNASRKH